MKRRRRLTAERLESRRLLAVLVTAAQPSQTVQVSDQFTIATNYATTPPELTTGVAIRLHFDPSKVDFVLSDATLSQESVPFKVVDPRLFDESASSDDGDARTTKYIQVQFADFVPPPDFPASFSPLFEAKFTAKAAGTAAFNYTFPFDSSIPASSATVTINESLPTVSVAVAPSSVNEDGTGALVYTFTRTGETTAALAVNYTVGGTANSGSDFTALSGTVTIPAGQSSTTISIDPTDDSTVEPDETIMLTITDAAAYDVGTPASATGTITNDDVAVVTPTVSLTVAPSSVNEDGTGALVYTFTRTGETTAALAVNYTVGGTANSGSDFTALSGTVTIPAGQSSTTISIDPTDDSTVEPDETIMLTITDAAAYDVGTPASATGTITNDDVAVVTPTVSLALAPSAVNEDGTGALVYTFTRTGETTAALAVNYTVGGTANSGSDFTALSGTVTIPVGQSSTTISIDPTDDTTVEPDETIMLTITDAAAYDVGTPASATGTITNDDVAVVTPTVSVAVAPSAVNEDGTGALVYTFTRTGETTTALAVSYTVGGTANSGSDFTALSGTVTIPVGQSSTTISLNPTDDTTVEPDETIILTITDAAAYDVGTPASATGTITNDDVAVVTPTVSLAVAPSAVNEDGTGALVYTFTRIGETTAALAVNYTVGGTATSGTDFTALSGTVTIPAGQSSTTISIDPTDDSTVEPDETIILTITDAAAYDVGTPASATGTITNDDVAAVTPTVSVAVAPSAVNEDGTSALVYTFTRTGQTTAALAVNYTVGGTATSGTDFTALSGTVTIPAGQSSTTISIDPTDDSTVEPDETIILTITDAAAYDVGTPASATGTITNDDVAAVTPTVSVAVAPSAVNEDGTGALVYTFTRTGETTTALAVSYTVGGTANSGSDFTALSGTVTIPVGQSSTTISLNPTDDTTVEPDETIILTITDAAAYDVGTPASATGTITNDDVAAVTPTVSVAVAPSAVNEDGTSALVYTFTRTGQTTAALAVNYTVGGTATSGTDFTALSGTVTIPAGQSSTTISIDPTDDSTVEPDETIILTITDAAAYDVGTPASATGTITNDDVAAVTPTVSVAVAPSAVNEDGTSALVYTFTRTGQTTAALAVNYTVGGTATSGTDFTALSGTVTIPAGQSSTTISVNPTDDSTVEPDETIMLTITDAAAYDVGTPASATGTITNDDVAAVTPTVSVAVAPSAVNEDGTSALVYTFTRTGQTTAALAVNYTIGGTANSGSDFTALSGTVTIPAGQSSTTISVNPTDDSTVEPDETIMLTITDAASYDVGTPASATGTITNDDQTISPSSLAITALNANQAEGNSGTTRFTFTVERSGSNSEQTTVQFSTSGVGANPANASDFVGGEFPSGPITFEPGETRKEVSIEVLGDTTSEQNEGFQVTLSNASGDATISNAFAQGVIEDDDRPQIQTRIFTPSIVATYHIIPGDRIPTAIIFRALADTTVTVSSVGGGSFTENIRVLDGNLQSIGEFANGATRADVIAGTLNAIIFEPQSSERIILIRSSKGYDTLGQRFINNIFQPTDTSGDGVTTALDALMVINALNRNQFAEGEPLPNTDALLDVNADGYVSALDALIVINHLSQTSMQRIASGEYTATSTMPWKTAGEPIREESPGEVNQTPRRVLATSIESDITSPSMVDIALTEESSWSASGIEPGFEEIQTASLDSI
ncbi:Calx-beta domain-containing protein [Neorhodopirellula pilleata]|nr:Calx-beta domain-containing protein [Neorhodopirellula pilleata]